MSCVYCELIGKIKTMTQNPLARFVKGLTLQQPCCGLHYTKNLVGASLDYDP